jgi:ribosome biogenesis GTPase
MSKRRINQQQLSRIQKKQSNFRDQLIAGSDESTHDGLIIKYFGRYTMVESTDGVRLKCSVRPNIGTLVAGDRIVWQKEGDRQGVVISRYPRKSILGRPDKQGQLKPIAANISQMLIVVAPKPDISWPLLDSYLVMGEFLKLQVCIILNKVDLPCDSLQKQLLQEYKNLGYHVLLTSFEDKKSYKVLQETLNNQTSVFVGQSGVGKSSIIARVLPLETNIQTAPISAKTELGCHTTSNSCLYHLPTGGSLIDSPGVREFGLWHMPSQEIAKGYIEFQPYLTQCKFRNCCHQHTPGCAILAAVNKKEISKHRYENYVKISQQFAI